MLQKLQMEPSLIQKMQLVGRIKVAELLSIPEPEFEQYIKQVERDPLFLTLKNKYRIISYRKFYEVKDKEPLEFKEESIAGEAETDLQELLDGNFEVLPLLKKIGKIVGEDTFRKILEGENNIKSIIKKCNLSSHEEKIFREFIDRFQLRQIINSSSFPSSTSPQYSRFFLIARIEKENGDLFIRPANKDSYLIRGRYQINHDRFKKLVEVGKIKKADIDEIVKLFKKIDLINHRTTTIYQILCCLKDVQRKFFQSGNILDIVPFTQTQLASWLNLNPSTVSRAIAGKSILTPQGEERPIKFFFSRRWIKNLIRKVIIQEKEEIKKKVLLAPLTDESIQERLMKYYGIYISRRTVSKYRKLLNIPPSHLRYS